MSTFSVDGLISGLNTTEIIQRLGALDRAPISRLRARQTTTNNALTALQDLKTRLTALRDKSQTLSKPAVFATLKASSSHIDVMTVSASSSASPGSYSISVDALASAHQIVTSTEFADKDAPVFGVGTIQVTLGSDSTEVAVGGANNSLAGIAESINASTAAVTATLVRGASGYRLALSANTAGAGSTISLTPSLAGGSAIVGAFDEWQAAADAQIRVGTGPAALLVTRSSNVISDVLPGVTLSLVSASAAPVTVRLERDAAAARTAVSDFVAAFNEVVALMREKTAYDPATRTAGPLQGNGTIARISQRINQLITTVLPESAGAIRQLADVGITVGRDGKLAVDNGKLDSAIGADLSGVRALFGTTGSASDPDLAFVSATTTAVAPAGAGYAVSITTAADAGVDVAGTINGEPATGRGQILTGNDGNATTSGLSIRVGLSADTLAAQGAAQGTVTFTHGIGAQLGAVIDDLIAADTGLLATSIKAASDRIKDFDRQIERTEARAAAREAGYRRQFAALESQLSTLQRQSQWLSQQIANLSGTGGTS